MSRLRTALLTTALLALLIRLSYLVLVFTQGGLRELAGIEVDSWETIARQVALGHGYVMGAGLQATALRLPVYPLFVAGLYRAFGLNPWPPVLAQAVLGALNAGGLAWLAARFTGRTRAAWIAGTLWALNPVDLAQTPYAASEPLFVLWVLASWGMWEAWRARPQASRAAGLGVLLGLLALTRDVGLVLAGCVLAAAAWHTLRAPHTWRAALALPLAFVAVWTPWPVRNLSALGAPIVSSTAGGYVLWANHLHIADANFLVPRPCLGPAPQFHLEDMATPGWEVRWDAGLRAEALRLIIAHPGRYLLMALNRWPLLWFGNAYGCAPRASFAVFGLFNAALLVAALYGWRRAPPAVRWSTLVLVVSVTAVYVAVAANRATYFLPAMPAWIILAAYGLAPPRAEPR